MSLVKPESGSWLRGSRVWLEPLADKHVSDIYAGWFNDPEVTKHTRHGSRVMTVDEVRDYVRSIQNSPATLALAMILPDTGEHVGNVSLNDISWANHSGEISIMLGARKCWGRGIGTEAVSLVVDFAFRTLRLHRVWLGMTVNNQGMLGIAQSLGFREEGILKEALFKDGRYLDIAQWYKLNPKPGVPDPSALRAW